MLQGATGFSALDFSAISSAITSVVTPSDIITLIATIVGAGIVFALAWFGGRKIIRAVMQAMQKGRVSV